LWRSNYVEANEDRTDRLSYHSAARYRRHPRKRGRTKASSSEAAGQTGTRRDEVKQLLLLIDTDQSGKISKQEWMKFMEAEFDRLDKDKKGQLDVKELTQSKLRVSHPVNVGK
jgi:EF hand